ncbi:hypothetical protein AMS68_006978 [Peltaster fructicola]|uniref:NAD(P)-binding domain-containing protein n=1 Tax=Peltaster fructicola TaxID=286661 RepID=A0A6H0Y3G8_9PEZI|nr:hypothetical protein AMS68_006978 [Peltaster fructicola]
MVSQKYLLTGVTGGLGGKILEDMLNRLNLPAASITATSRSESSRGLFESQGLNFKVLDYDRPETIREALVGVDNFLFMSASEFDNDKRRIMHRNVVDAAKAVGVRKTWYVSLAFGGFGVNEKVSVQAVHNWTEEMLIESNMDFVSIRAGVYADAFPLFMNWYPESKAIHLPKLEPPVSSGYIALTSRDELGEGIASLLTQGLEAHPSIKPHGERQIVLLTSAVTSTFIDIANAINSVRIQQQPVDFLEPTEWVEDAAKTDLGSKSKAWFETRLTWFREMCNGALETTDPALETLLGRKPLSGVEIVKSLVGGSNGEYTWHQNSGGARSAK